jgi:hypothetical protein
VLGPQHITAAWAEMILLGRSCSEIKNMGFEFEEIPYSTWGPWRNQWGYVTVIAHFDEDDIILKCITPEKKKFVKRFCDWEDCEEMIELIEQDRRF